MSAIAGRLERLEVVWRRSVAPSSADEAALRRACEAVAAERGLDPEEVLAEAVWLIEEGRA